MIKLDGTHKVEIRQDGYTQVYVDGVKLRRVREINFHQSTEEAPNITLDIFGAPTLNMDAFVEIKASSDKYLEYLNEKIKESEGDTMYVLMECRSRYLALLGGEV